MKIDYESNVYDFDLDELDISQATTIKRKYGFTLLSLEAGLREGDPDALRCVYWLMLVQAGQNVNIDNVHFKPVKFANAIQNANLAEIEAEAAKGDTPKEES